MYDDARLRLFKDFQRGLQQPKAKLNYPGSLLKLVLRLTILVVFIAVPTPSSFDFQSTRPALIDRPAKTALDCEISDKIKLTTRSSQSVITKVFGFRARGVLEENCSTRHDVCSLSR